ncbi:MAG: hypothetical protein LBH28_09900 [Oscillospiraceae bacterium]|jgi:hypothetical protein|nr:hypothetical protein [Oscillospiraceae bacterium]
MTKRNLSMKKKMIFLVVLFAMVLFSIGAVAVATAQSSAVQTLAVDTHVKKMLSGSAAKTEYSTDITLYIVLLTLGGVIATSTTVLVATDEKHNTKK